MISMIFYVERQWDVYRQGACILLSKGPRGCSSAKRCRAEHGAKVCGRATGVSVVVHRVRAYAGCNLYKTSLGSNPTSCASLVQFSMLSGGDNATIKASKHQLGLSFPRGRAMPWCRRPGAQDGSVFLNFRTH